MHVANTRFKGKNQETPDALELLGKRKMHDVRLDIKPTFSKTVPIAFRSILDIFGNYTGKIIKISHGQYNT